MNPQDARVAAARSTPEVQDMSKKPIKIIVPEEVLRSLAPEDRERVRSELETMFQGFDPTGPVPPHMREVHRLPPGPNVCPSCKTTLKQVTTITTPAFKSEPATTFDLFDCPGCDNAYERVAAS